MAQAFQALLDALFRVERVSAEILGRVGPAASTIRDRELRSLAVMLEAYSALSLGLSRALRDYVYVRVKGETATPVSKPALEDVEAALRLVTEALDSIAELEESVKRVRSVCRDENVIGLLEAWSSIASRIRDDLQELRRRLEKELAELQERPLPEAQ